MRHWGVESHVGRDHCVSGVLLERLRQALLWSRLPFLHCCKGNKKDGIKQRGQAKRWLQCSRWPVRNLKNTHTHTKRNRVIEGGVTKSFSFSTKSGGKADMHLHLFAKTFRAALFWLQCHKQKKKKKPENYYYSLKTVGLEGVSRKLSSPNAIK